MIDDVGHILIKVGVFSSGAQLAVSQVASLEAQLAVIQEEVGSLRWRFGVVLGVDVWFGLFETFFFLGGYRNWFCLDLFSQIIALFDPFSPSDFFCSLLTILLWVQERFSFCSDI